ncbi:MAG: helix-turn-helix transcriptional regulator, partial [Tepidisphaeraceae bacterium]
HYTEPWRLADLGRMVGVSPNHLVQLFTRDVGVSPHRYLVQRRIERAKELLRQSDVPITQLALDLGFSSSQHFAKTFRQMAKCPARRFRQRYQEAGKK